jgi:hypothetical protein
MIIAPPPRSPRTSSKTAPSATVTNDEGIAWIQNETINRAVRTNRIPQIGKHIWSKSRGRPQVRKRERCANQSALSKRSVAEILTAEIPSEMARLRQYNALQILLLIAGRAVKLLLIQ